MIRALIFDCFGVLYWDDINRLYNLVSTDKFQEVNDLVHAFDHGYTGKTEFVAQVAALAGISVEAVEAVTTHKERRNEALIARVRELKARYKIGLLSNMGQDTLDEVFDAAERAELFDDVLISSDVGMIKPSRDLYELALERLGTAAEETLFIDDRPSNIDGAERLGIKTILFSTNQEFEQSLQALTKTGDA